jgi:hypothetical protein
MPEGFTGIDPSVPNEVMLPFAARELTTPGAFDPDRWGSCSLVARLDPAVPAERARLAAEALVHGFIEAHPPKESYELPRLWMTDVSRGMDSLRTATSRPLLILFSMVAATLLIACANVAGLIVARGEARRREVATRYAVGASRARIVRQLLIESLILCVIAGALGTALVYSLRAHSCRISCVRSRRFRAAARPGNVTGPARVDVCDGDDGFHRPGLRPGARTSQRA